MRLYESSGMLQRYRQISWEFQQTVHTPLKDLERFVDVIMGALTSADRAIAVFHQVVFPPQHGLLSLYAKYSLPEKWYGDDVTIEAQSAAEAGELLQAVLSEWIDFLFVPTPEPFVIYADHDKYITFLAHQKSQLSSVVEELTAAKFRPVDYVRKL
jgi:hypothetical protein